MAVMPGTGDTGGVKPSGKPPVRWSNPGGVGAGAMDYMKYVIVG